MGDLYNRAFGNCVVNFPHNVKKYLQKTGWKPILSEDVWEDKGAFRNDEK